MNPSEYKRQKIKRIVLLVLAIFLILIGWSSPLLMIIDFIPDELSLMCGGVALIGVGSLIILLISTGEI